MNYCVEAKNLSKRFLVLKTKATALRALLALITRKSLKRENWVLKDISFQIKKGEKLAIVGKNGSGKTTLLRILTGIYDKTSGEIIVKGNPKALFRFWIGLNGELSVIDNIYLFGTIHRIERHILEHKITDILEMSELSHLQFSPLKELSMGQHQRLALSIFFQTTGDFLIFDESLAFVDKGFAKKCDSYFEELFCSDKTVIITSHDNTFLKKYCKSAIWLDKGQIRAAGEVKEVVEEYEDTLLV